jgi:hypothetical protein
MKILKSDSFFYLTSALLAVILGFLPLFYNLFLPVLPNKFNPLWHNWPYDFSYYLSFIKQGADGSLQALSKYTTEPQTSSFIRFSYVLLGFLGGHLLRFDPTFLYHLYRIIFSLLTIFAAFLFLHHFLKDKTSRKLSFLLFLFAGPFYLLHPGQPLTAFVENFLPWQTFVFPFRRLSFLPHYLFANTALLTSLLLFFRAADKKNPKAAFLAGLFLGLAGLDHPPTLVFAFILLTAYTLLNLFLKIEKNQKLLFKNYFFLSLPILFFGLYLIKTFSSFPWNIPLSVGLVKGNLLHTLLSFGPPSFLSLFSFVFLKKILKSRLFTLSFLWLSLSLFLTFFASRLFIFAHVRFLEVVLYLPMAVLTIFFLQNLKIPKKAIIILTFLIIIGTLPGTLKDYYEDFRLINSLSHEPYSIPPMLPYIDYPTKSLMEAINFLDKNTAPNEVVLSHFFAGNLIPAYSGNTVYFGHPPETYQFWQKHAQVIEFFSGKLTPPRAHKFLTENRIQYLFWGLQEKAINPRFDIMTYPSLAKIFQNSEVTLFKFQK